MKGAETGRNPPAARDLSADRRVLLDVLRGCALFGMILVHVSGFLMIPGGWWEGVTREGIALLVQGKARAVFAFLFGVSFALMAARLEREHRPVVPSLLRRLAALYAIGWVVEILTRFQILREYAWWGVVLLFVRGLPTRTLLALAGLSAAALAVRDCSNSAWLWAWHGREQAIAADHALLDRFAAERARVADAESGRSYPETVVARLNTCLRGIWSYNQITPGATLAFFLLGILAWRHGILTAPTEHPAWLVGVGLGGVALWGVHHWLLPAIPDVLATPMIVRHLRSGFGIVTDQALAFAYLAVGCVLLDGRTVWSRVRSGLSAAGRMGLTNYLLQAVALEVAIWSGCSLPWWEALGWSVALFCAQMMASQRWLNAHPYGPVEWALRAAIHWRPIPWRR
ncbi:MAG: DUF418 domain-containing protein [Verrucomicrobia bacterium]|nr:DUF418 domain-containing protein [Verrucomicrobiota bacterium]